MAKRGHSNVKADQTKEWSKVDKKCASGYARIPIWGGSSPTSWNELPPLSLRKEEWEMIGEKMGWTSNKGQVELRVGTIAYLEALIDDGGESKTLADAVAAIHGKTPADWAKMNADAKAVGEDLDKLVARYGGGSTVAGVLAENE